MVKPYFIFLSCFSSFLLYGQQPAVVVVGVPAATQKEQQEEELARLLKGLQMLPDIDTIYVAPPPGEAGFADAFEEPEAEKPIIVLPPAVPTEGQTLPDAYNKKLSEFILKVLSGPVENEDLNPASDNDSGQKRKPFPRLAFIGPGAEHGLLIDKFHYLTPQNLAGIINEANEKTNGRAGVKILTNATFQAARMERIFELVYAKWVAGVIPFGMDIGEVRDYPLTTGTATGEVIDPKFPNWIFIPAGIAAAVPLIIVLTDKKNPCKDDGDLPVISCPADLTLPCGQNPEPVPPATALDDCDPDPEITFSDIREPIRIIRTWTALDQGGNSVACQQIIALTDTEPPSFQTVPEDLQLECMEDLPVMPALPWTDNCAGGGTATGQEIVKGDGCTVTISREWTATDPSGNRISAVQIITVNDNVPPQFETPPSDITVCFDQIPQPTPLRWTDNCDGPGEVTLSEVRSGTTCPIIIIRTWSYTDQCGNFASVSQTITVVDEEPPQLAEAPQDITVNCIGEIPEEHTLVWTDNCDGDGEVKPHVTQSGSTCPITITRTWSYTDHCNNLASVSQTITVNDQEPPQFVSPPQDITVSCMKDIPAAQPLTWTDNCDGTGVAPPTDQQTGSTCPITITRTWSYTDQCGNTASVSQTIIFNDNEAPVFVNPPQNITVQCIEDIPAAQPLAWTDNCDGTGLAHPTDQQTGSTCPITITRTWSYTDQCGNTASVSQTIIFNDNEAPVFVNPPQNITVQCIEDIPAAQPLAWTDNCDGTGVAHPTDQQTGSTCPITITRTWSYTDQCGNTASVSQIITLHDDENPLFVNPPQNITVQCTEDIPVAQPLTWTDNCDGTGVAHSTDQQTGSTCPITITRIWSYTDMCGNTASVSQIITLHDDENPLFVNPPQNITVQCTEDIPVAQPLTWTDNCDGTGVAHSTDQQTGSTCPITITRTWTYTDLCGNTASVNQNIMVDDEQPPSIITPASSETVECTGATASLNAWLSANGGAEAIDNCGAEPVWSNNFPGFNGPTGSVTVVFTATDDCGNFSHTQATFSVEDNIPPVITCPTDKTVNCGENTQPPATGQVTALDACDPALFPDFSDQISPGDCPVIQTISRTWTVTDPAGNFATCVQNISIQDNSPPAITINASNVTITCDPEVNPFQLQEWLDSNGGATATDNCGNITWTNNFSGLSNGCGNTGSATVTFTATDDCGNPATTTATFTITDNTPPVITVPAGAGIFECDGQGNTAELNAWISTRGGAQAADACGTVTWSHNFSGLSNGCGATGSAAVTFTATDACGNSSSTTAVFSIVDNTPPVIITPASNLAVPCDVAANPGQLNSWLTSKGGAVADDNCSDPVVWSNNFNGLNFTCGNAGSAIVTFTATDACGRTATTAATFSTFDNLPPVMSGVPSNTPAECNNIPGPATVTATDNCSGFNLQFSETTSFECPITVTRTWTATDQCGNISSATQVITADDNEAPAATHPPVDETIFCPGPCFLCEIPPVPDPVFVDNCDEFLTISFTEESLPPFLIRRTWIASDDCGNSVTIFQLIHFICGEVFQDPPQTGKNPVAIYPERLLPPAETGLQPDGLSAYLFSGLNGQDAGAVAWKIKTFQGPPLMVQRRLQMAYPVKPSLEITGGIFYGTKHGQYLYEALPAGRSLAFSGTWTAVSGLGGIRFFPGAGRQFFVSGGMRLNYSHLEARHIQLSGQPSGDISAAGQWGLSSQAGAGMRMPWSEAVFLELEGGVYHGRSLRYFINEGGYFPEIKLRLGYRFPLVKIPESRF